MTSAVRRTARRLAATAALAGAGCLLAGCGSASPPSPPAGVDGLVIPTPSPDPDDFVDGVDNAWLPLEQGRSWTYEEVGDDRVRTVRVTGTREAAGVEATAVQTVEGGTTTTDLYAQDRDGNVWWLGREGVWEAGVDGARAGLAMPATPRVGDGFRTALAPGVTEQRATVASVTGMAGGYDDTVLLEVEDDLRPGRVLEQAYAPGVGLVREELDPAPGGSDEPTTWELAD